MNILNICTWDYGGYGINLTKAINQYTEHKSRHIAIRSQWIGYEKDIFTGDPNEVKKWIKWADIVNSLNNTHPLFLFGITSAGKMNVIVTYLGTSYRSKPYKTYEHAKQFGAKIQLVDTPEMTKYDGLKCVPPAIPVKEYEKMKRSHIGKPIVCQSPSNRRTKNTNKIISALSSKKNIDLLIVEGVTWKKCMELKSVADIYIGSFTSMYGMGSLEAWGMGIPCIDHMFEPNRSLYLKEIGYLPYYETPIDKLTIAVDALLNDKKLYKEYADLGKKYVRDFHDYPVVAKQFIEVCESIL